MKEYLLLVAVITVMLSGCAIDVTRQWGHPDKGQGVTVNRLHSLIEHWTKGNPKFLQDYSECYNYADRATPRRYAVTEHTIRPYISGMDHTEVFERCMINRHGWTWENTTRVDTTKRKDDLVINPLSIGGYPKRPCLSKIAECPELKGSSNIEISTTQSKKQEAPSEIGVVTIHSTEQGDLDQKNDIESRLIKIKKLFDSGLITQEEYNSKRAEIINEL